MNEVRKAKIKEYDAEVKKIDEKCNEASKESANLLDDLFHAIEKEGSDYMNALVKRINANAETVIKYKERINEIKKQVLKIALCEVADKILEEEGHEEEEDK